MEDLAPIVVAPGAIAVASPPVSIVETLVAEESQVTDEVTSPVLLFPKDTDNSGSGVEVQLHQQLAFLDIIIPAR